MTWINKLYYGDCLTIMQEMPKHSVDLIYLDPPFSSNREYNAIYKDETGRPLPDQLEAFNDIWVLDEVRDRAIRHMPVLMREHGIPDDVVEFWRVWMNALRRTNPKLLAYLSYMTERLALMRNILRPTGSIYLHCDPTAGHYIKVMMDGLFGHENFRNEIVWKRTAAHSGAKRFGPIHDTILFYTKSDSYKWNTTYQAYSEEYVEKHYRHQDSRGKYRISDLTAAGTRTGESGQPWKKRDPTPRHWAVPRRFPGAENLPSSPLAALDYLDDIGRVYWPRNGEMPGFKRYLHEMRGMKGQSIWTDIPPVSGKERMGYDTQKPVPLLERIINSSSDVGDTVFDPFCGCATTLEAAHRLDRKWIGIDIAIHAIKRVAVVRLHDRLKLREGEHFTIEGVPRNLEGAQDLWERDKYHFQKWAVEQVEGFVTSRKTADGGIDGRLYFAVAGRKDLHSMVIEVKGGRNVGIADLRALRGVLDTDTATMAGLIVLHPPGDTKARNFHKFMAEAGDEMYHGRDYSRMQLLTVEQILAGQVFDTPGAVGKGSTLLQLGLEHRPKTQPTAELQLGPPKMG